MFIFRPAAWLLLLTVLPVSALAQMAPDSLDSAVAVERLLERTDPESATDELIEWLSDRVTQPVNANSASAAELARLPGLSMVAALRIVSVRANAGPFSSLDAVQRAARVDDQTFALLRPFLAVPEGTPSASPGRDRLLRQLEGRLIQRMTRRLDVGRGYDRDSTRRTYAGSPERWYTRLQLRNTRRLQLNLTLEKDPGEAFLWKPATRTYGFDHVSAHAMLRDVGPIETLIVGDYTVSFGQGIGLWESFSFSKGRDVIGPATRQAPGISPFGSTEENRFFRGVAATAQVYRGVSTSAFASRRSLDATTSLASSGERIPARRTESGLHRTPTELANKDVLNETVVGGAVQWRIGASHLGLAGYHSLIGQSLAVPSDAFRRFDPTGPRHYTLSAFGGMVWGDVYAFGEWVRSPRSWGGTGGIQIDKTIADAVVSLRHFPPTFTSLHGRAFAERGDPPTNETGAYIAARIRPAAHWQISGFVDQYRFPWLRFGTPRPTSGIDTRVVIEHTPRPWLSYYLQGRHETKDEGVRVGSSPVMRGVRPATRQSLRLHSEFTFSDRLTFRMRVEGVRSRRASGRAIGTLLYQGVRWRPTPWLRLDTRWALFDTEDYAARIYAYEHDLLYAFSIPVFNGQGARHYLLARVAPSEHLRIELKYAATRYRNVASVGSGLDEVAGRRLRDIRAQVRWRF